MSDITVVEILPMDMLSMSIVVLFVGMFLNRKIRVLGDNYIPPAVTGGLLFAVGTAIVPMNLRTRDPAAHGRLMELSFGSYHSGGAFFAMGDGSVQFLAETIELQVYQALFSRNGGEIVGND